MVKCSSPPPQVFLLGGRLEQHLSKARFRHRFDRVHVATTAADVWSTPLLEDALADEAIVAMDTAK